MRGRTAAGPAAAASLFLPVVLLLGLVTAGSVMILVRLEDPRLLWAGMLGAAVVAIALGRPAVAIVLVLSWLPLMGFIRRLFDTLGFVQFDPLLAVGPGIAAAMALLAFHRFRGTVGRSLRASPPTLFVTLLCLVGLVRAVNPLTSSVYENLASGLFLMAPILWYFLGRAHLDEWAVRRVLVATVVIGAICGLFGFHQAFVGFLPSDEDWIAWKVDRFQSLHIGRFIRPFSTFANPEEWSRYMAVAGTVAVGLLVVQRRGRLWLAGAALVSAGAIVISGVRTSVFGFVLSLGVVLWLTARSRPAALARVAALTAGLSAFLALAPRLSWQEVEASRVAWLAFLGHSARGVRAPLEEGTLMTRFDLWVDVLTHVIPSYPLGMGPTDVTESYLVSLFVETGIPGGLFFLGVLGTLALHARRLHRARRDRTLHVVTAVLTGIAFTSIIGNSLALYSVGPLGWALAGWLSAQPVTPPPGPPAGSGNAASRAGRNRPPAAVRAG